MKKLRAILLAAVCLPLLYHGGWTVSAARFDFADPVGYVNDFANVLTTDQAIDDRLRAFDVAESTQILVITVDSLPGDVSLEEFVPYLTDEHEKWRAGTAENDNGVILTVVMESRDMRIDVGYGLEGALPDITARSILDNEMRPHFRDGDYDGGVDAGVTAIMAAVTGEYTPTESAESSSSFSDNSEGFICCCMFVGSFVFPWLGSFLGRSKSWWLGGVFGFVAGLIGAVALSFVPAWGWARFLGFGLLPLPLAGAGLLFDFIVSKNYKVRKSSGRPTGLFSSWGGFSSGGHSSFGGGGGGGFSGGGGGSFGGGGSSSGW